MIYFFLIILSVFLFLLVFIFLYKRTIAQILTTVDKTTDLFASKLSEIQLQHFEQLEKVSDKQLEVFSATVDKQSEVFSATVDKVLKMFEETKEKQQEQKQILLDQITRLGDEENQIEEKAEEEQHPLDDSNFIPMKPGMNFNVQIDGEEKVMPIEIQ